MPPSQSKLLDKEGGILMSIFNGRYLTITHASGHFYALAQSC